MHLMRGYIYEEPSLCTASSITSRNSVAAAVHSRNAPEPDPNIITMSLGGTKLRVCQARLCVTVRGNPYLK